MSKTRLPTLDPPREKLGAPTIMDPDLAARYGAPYVHLAAFAIDVDRVRALVEAEEDDSDLPFGWEVFLTEAYLLSFLDLGDEADRLMVVEACKPLVGKRPTGEPPPLGAQLAFALHDAVERGAAPAELGALFRGWGKGAAALTRDLASLWEDPGPHLDALCDLCADAPLEPPLTEPTARALDDLHLRDEDGTEG